jgi:hypothetical protein
MPTGHDVTTCCKCVAACLFDVAFPASPVRTRLSQRPFVGARSGSQIPRHARAFFEKTVVQKRSNCRPLVSRPPNQRPSRWLRQNLNPIDEAPTK